jgi:hypothetical protein
LTAIDRFPTHLVCVLALLGTGGLACSGRAVPVDVRATLPDSEPLVGVTITALPYDPGRLLDSLAAADTEPTPDYSALEAELLGFQRPAPPEDDSTTRVWRATRDSVRRLADSLRAVDRRAPGYAAAYARFRRLYGRLMERSGARDAALRSLTADVRDLAERAGRAADSLRRWERVAYAGFDSAAARAVAASGRAPTAAETDPEGWARFELTSGDWWLALRVSHPENPFAEYRWDVPVTVAGFPIRIPLTRENAHAAWRH